MVNNHPHGAQNKPRAGTCHNTVLIGIMAVFYPTSVKVQHAAPLHL